LDGLLDCRLSCRSCLSSFRFAWLITIPQYQNRNAEHETAEEEEEEEEEEEAEEEAMNEDDFMPAQR
jgi:hypothetical protein